MVDIDRPGAEQWVPKAGGIEALRTAATRCRGCELWGPATQVVFSSGSDHARAVFVGEQPGDQEDKQGLPFVGPAGRLLREALDAAGFAESDIYLTNAVKHFHYEQRPERGKRRIHKTPNRSHIVACSPWLDAELKSIEPEVVVVLGSTAASAVLGPKFRLTPNRGKVIEHPSGRAWQVLPTVHPSSVLRLRGKPEWESAFTSFVGDLDIAARLLR